MENDKILLNSIVPKTMYGATIEQYGSFRVVKYQEQIPTKPLKIFATKTEKRVVVKIYSASVNSIDIRIRKGEFFNTYW
jgi:NADPH:quinone reductase-like Zn-dependent oxidoreductase